HTAICGIRPAPHFLGDSVACFWPLYPADGPAGRVVPYHWLNTRLSEDEYRAVRARQGSPWPEVRSRYLEQSVVAIVPRGHGYPAEWGPWRDGSPPHVVRGHPYFDAIFRNQPGLTLDAELAGPVQSDACGPFRVLEGRGAVSFREPAPAPVTRLTIRHEGQPG